MTLTADEYEARLRDAVFCYYNALPCVSTAHDHGDGFGDDLDAYIDWLRMRAVAESVSPARGGVPVCDCAGHTAQRRMAELLAAEVTA